MKHEIYYYKTFGEGPSVEVESFSLFTNRAGYTTYSLSVNRFERHPDTSSGWVGRAFNPETKAWVEFPYRSHYTIFHIYNGNLGGPERAFTVFLIPESQAEEELVTNCQACVRWEPWAFQVCLIPDKDFQPTARAKEKTFREDAQLFLKRSLGLSVRPRKFDRERLINHAFEFLMNRYGEEVAGEGWVMRESDVVSFLRELQDAENPN